MANSDGGPSVKKHGDSKVSNGEIERLKKQILEKEKLWKGLSNVDTLKNLLDSFRRVKPGLLTTQKATYLRILLLKWEDWENKIHDIVMERAGLRK